MPSPIPVTYLNMELGTDFFKVQLLIGYILTIILKFDYRDQGVAKLCGDI